VCRMPSCPFTEVAAVVSMKYTAHSPCCVQGRFAKQMSNWQQAGGYFVSDSVSTQTILVFVHWDDRNVSVPCDEGMFEMMSGMLRHMHDVGLKVLD
jgi:hypothetical protein